MESFLPCVAPPEEADHRDQHEAGLDEDLATVERVDAVALQGGVGEQAVEEESSSGEIDAEMEGLP